MDIRPLTVLLGKNNAGKSALVRLSMLLLRSLCSRSRAPLDLQVANAIDFGSTLGDVIHGHRPHDSIELGASFLHEGDTLHLDVTIQEVTGALPGRDSDYSVVSSWQASGACSLALTWKRTPVQPPEYHEAQDVRFRGLWPVLAEPAASSRMLSTWWQQIDELRGATSYLGPLRPLIPRVMSRVEPKGSSHLAHEAAQWLAADEDLRRRVSEWYVEHLEGWEVHVDVAGSAFHCVLKRGATMVNIADAGQGMAQVLPVVVQQMLVRAIDEPSRLHLVEQPELHLHPAAHGAIADLFVDSVKTPGVCSIVETHSENFLLRLRRRVAEGRLSPEQVALYWVDERDGASVVERLGIDIKGELTSWPEGVFSESYDEVIALRRAARARDIREAP